MSVDGVRSLDGVIGRSGRVRSLFQPIVDLSTRATVGYEALARFPHAPHLGPAEVFAQARSTGALGDLDWECRRSAMMGATRGGLRGPLHLFMNLEPSVLGAPPPWPIDPRHVADAVEAVPTVIELTERALLTDPRSVLWAADWARERSCLIALDDVGVNPDSVAMLSLVRPDIVKLDRLMLGAELTVDQERTLRAVWDHVGDSDSRILCEGIECEADLDRARSLGATLVQGFHLGRPGPLEITDEILAAAGRSRALTIEPDRGSAMPIVPTDILRRSRPRVSRLSEIASLGGEFEAEATRNRSQGLVLLSVHLGELFTPDAAKRFAQLAETNTLVGVIGVGDEGLPHGVRGARIKPLRDQVALVVVDTDCSIAIVARDLGDTGPIPDRRYEWTITHDDLEVAGVARALLRRLAPLPVEGAYAHTRAKCFLIPDHTTSGDHRRMLSDVAEMAVRLVPGAESVGLSLVTLDHGFTTVAADPGYPALLDELQQHYGVGPGLEPSGDDTVIHIADLDSDERWASYRQVVNAAAPIGSVLSFRLFTGLATSGLITFYTEQSWGFDAAAVEVAHEVAAYTQMYWIALRASTSQETPTVIPRADLSRVIDRAVGVDADALGRTRTLFDRAVREGRSIEAVAAEVGSR